MSTVTGNALVKIRMSRRELAMVVAALRYWQSRDEGDFIDDDVLVAFHFHPQPPLNSDRINNLCDRMKDVEDEPREYIARSLGWPGAWGRGATPAEAVANMRKNGVRGQRHDIYCVPPGTKVSNFDGCFSWSDPEGDIEKPFLVNKNGERIEELPARKAKDPRPIHGPMHGEDF